MTVTYGVMGMMEWVALIPTRSNLLRVRFSGGSLSGYGVSPATFTTSNVAVAHMIEESHYFKSGKIRLLGRRDDPVDSEAPRGPEKPGDTSGVRDAGSADDACRPVKKPKR